MPLKIDVERVGAAVPTDVQRIAVGTAVDRIGSVAEV